MGHTVFIVGAGRIGTGLALALRDTEHDVLGIWNRSEAARTRAANLSGVPTFGGSLQATPLNEAGIVMLCVSDDAIFEVAQEISDVWFSPGAVVAHTSGCHNSNLLEHIAGVSRGSLHPLAACPTPERAGAAMRTALFAVEGEPDALTKLSELAQSLSGRVAHVASADKVRYHAAAVLASNLVVALVDVANELAADVGLGDAKSALIDLAEGALMQVKDLEIHQGLTGPAARGDRSTVLRHLEELEGPTRELYRALSERAVEIAQRGDESAALTELAEALKS